MALIVALPPGLCGAIVIVIWVPASGETFSKVRTLALCGAVYGSNVFVSPLTVIDSTDAPGASAGKMEAKCRRTLYCGTD